MENSTEKIVDEQVENQTLEQTNDTTDFEDEGFDYESLSDEDKARYDEINEIIKAEKLDPTTSLNILINAVQVSYDKDHFNDLDRFLIAKSLSCLKTFSDAGEDIVIKVS
jgi:hypothetical protein